MTDGSEHSQAGILAEAPVLYQHQRRQHAQPPSSGTSNSTDRSDSRNNNNPRPKRVLPRRIVPHAPPSINVSSPPHAHLKGGHQFTVGNVSNGMIYLRPVVRPAHELHKNYVLPPTTPPNSGEDRAKDAHRIPYGPSSPPRTPTQSAAPTDLENTPPVKFSPPKAQTRHHRSLSHGTYSDSIRDTGFGKFHIKIDQVDGPTGELRPRTAGQDKSFQSLDVQIPHYNLGSPRFSPNGTPFLYGTSSVNLASSVGPGSSRISDFEHADARWRSDMPFLREMTPSIMSAMAAAPIESPHLQSPEISGMSPKPSTLMLLHPAPAMLPPHLSPPLSPKPEPMPPAPDVPMKVTPEMFDKLSFPPASELPTVVRFDPNTGEIVAAIPARIIAQITSATFVDYHLLSDFFLTYRLFMGPSNLAAHLIARLRWAVNREDDAGKVVRVRTFVAIRHWLLNYFADDFVPSTRLRRDFARQLNELSRALSAANKQADLKIIGELKRCWRRTCALYWDTVEEDGSEVDITPGGRPGNRDDVSQRPRSQLLRLPSLTPPPKLEMLADISEEQTFLREVVQPLKIFKEKELAKDPRVEKLSKTETTSSASSMPLSTIKSARITELSDRIPPSTTSALTPAKRLRPSTHKRSGSFSDALRDNRQPLPLNNTLVKSTQLLMAIPYSRSLVRGNLFPPTPAFVEVIAPPTPAIEVQQLRLNTASSSETSASTVVQEKSPGPGVRRLFGSVRKAIGGRHGAETKTQRQRSARPKLPPAKATPVEAPQEESRGDTQVSRMDLLGAGALVAFQRAIQQQLEDARNLSSAVTSENGSMQSNRHMDGAEDGKTDVVVELGSAASDSGEMIMDVPLDASPSIKQESASASADVSASATPLSMCEPFSPVSALSHLDNLHLESGEVSFLADRSDMSVSARTSVVTSTRVSAIEPPPQSPALSIAQQTLGPPPNRNAQTPSPVPTSPRSSVSMRRSKSFSFERIPPLNRALRNIDEHSTSPAGITIDVRSLHSARSFSLKRQNSVLSTFSNTMDNISEFSGFTNSLISTTEEEVPVSRGLRRRPGGNLRNAATVGDLELPERPKSTGSIDTFSLAADSLYMPPARRLPTLDRETIASSCHPVAAGVVSLGAVAQGGGAQSSPSPPSVPQGELSPKEKADDAKASFDAGVQLLRELPDDESDDGGYEVALAKLEGTYPRKKSGASSPLFEFRMSLRKSGMEFSNSMNAVQEREHEQVIEYDGADDSDDDEPSGGEHERRLRRRHKQVVDHVALDTPPLLNNDSTARIALVREESEDSVPILERGLSIDTQWRKTRRTESLKPRSNRRDSFYGGPLSAPLPSEPVNLKRIDSELEEHLRRTSDEKSRSNSQQHTNSIQRTTDGTSMRTLSTDQLSFEMVTAKRTSTKNSAVSFPPINANTVITELPPTSPNPLQHPPSPPLTLSQALSLPTSIDRVQVSPDNSQAATAGQSGTSGSTCLLPTAIHLPFILAYDSELLAKQFTLIEKDALLEVDWKELVELDWRQHIDSNARDWVEMLGTMNLKGVEIVIARFNLMVSWTRSTLVLTRSLSERARTLTKLIHIAAHSRKLHNFATMYQITISLLHPEIARLSDTWDRIGHEDLLTFRELETLVQPVANWGRLRREMETVSDGGVVPFVGLFTHDLIENARRPACVGGGNTYTAEEIERRDGAGGGAKEGSVLTEMVNFERHRVTAGIVKRLLRLIEMSQRYAFEAVDGVCERCLWIAGLSEGEIKGLSRGIEP